MKLRLIFIPLAAFVPAAALAQERPEVLNRITACRSITNDAQRLACFDQQVGALQAAEAAREIAVIDRQQVRRARRTLFGLTLPNLGIFGGGGDEDDEEGVSEINSTVRSTYTGGDGRAVFVLEDGAVWIQTEGRRGRARPGDAIRIRRGPLGSFIANIADHAGIRVIRQR